MNNSTLQSYSERIHKFIARINRRETEDYKGLVELLDEFEMEPSVINAFY